MSEREQELPEILRELHAEDKVARQTTQYIGGLNTGYLYGFDDRDRWSAVYLWTVGGLLDVAEADQRPEAWAVGPWTCHLSGAHHNAVPHDPEHFVRFFEQAGEGLDADVDFALAEGFEVLYKETFAERLPIVLDYLEEDESTVPWELAADWQPWTDAPEGLREATWEDLVEEPDPAEQEAIQEAIAEQHERIYAEEEAHEDRLGPNSRMECPYCGTVSNDLEWEHAFECPECENPVVGDDIEWTPISPGEGAGDGVGDRDGGRDGAGFDESSIDDPTGQDSWFL